VNAVGPDDAALHEEVEHARRIGSLVSSACTR
jgi:hypothetical protein